MTRFSFTERAKRFKFNNVTVMWFITVTLLFGELKKLSDASK